MRIVRLALALVVVASASATSAFAVGRQSATNGSIGIQLLEAPTARADDPRARLYVVDHVAPGASIRRKLLFTNSSSAPVSVDTYAAGAGIAGGAFTGGDGRTPNELSTWTTVTPQHLSIPAGGKVIGAVEIHIPRSASSGERYAVAWAESRLPASKGGVNEVNRVGIRIYLSVGAGGEPPSNFTIDSMTASRSADGRPTVSAQVHNTGGRALDMSGSLKLTQGPGSLTAGPFKAELGTTLGIGQTEPVTVLLDKALPAGPWAARLDLQSGLLKRAATATITFPDKGSAAPVSAKLVEDKKSPPWLAITAGVLGLIALGLLLLFFLKRRSRPEDRRDSVVTTTTGS